jgi:hypothetical protein
VRERDLDRHHHSHAYAHAHLAGLYRDEGVLPSLQVLAYLSKYPHMRQALYKQRNGFHLVSALAVAAAKAAPAVVSPVAPPAPELPSRNLKRRTGRTTNTTPRPARPPIFKSCASWSAGCRAIISF